MRKQQECSRCHNKFWTNQIKVYVLKTRNCPDCKEPCKVTDNKIFTCQKCGKIVEKEKSSDYGLMPVQVRETIRNYEDVAKMLVKDNTLEVEKVFVSKNQVCQSCKNFLSHRNALYKNEHLKKKKEPSISKIREVPKEQAMAEIKKLVIQKHIQELQEKMKKEKEEKRQEILKKLEEKSDKNAEEKENIKKR